MKLDLAIMVHRFLKWSLPEDFSPDCYIYFNKETAKENSEWPTGTNLLNAEQAKQMIEYISIPIRERAWLIELIGTVNPHWFSIKANFNINPNEAIKFNTKEEADNFITLIVMPLMPNIEIDSGDGFISLHALIPFTLQSKEHVFV